MRDNAHCSAAAGRDLPPGTVGIIYALRDVRQDGYRYVGLTTTRPAERMWAHWTAARAGAPGAVCRWLEKRLDERHLIEMIPLQVVMTSREDLGAAEIRWIAELRARGHKLLNLTAGGRGGGLGQARWTPERRAAHMERMATFRHSPESRALMSEQRTGTRVGADNPNYGRVGVNHPAYGSVRSADTRRRLSAQKSGDRNPNGGKSPAAETRAKQSASTKGVPRPSSIRNAHTRYHTNKGVTKDGCRHCADDARPAALD